MLKLPPACARKFRVVRHLGDGTYGSVHLVTQIDLERPAVVKILRPEVAADPEQLGRFDQEARLTAMLTHPHIVVVLDHGVEDGIPWIAYEYVPGRALREVLRNGPLPWPEALRIVSQIAQALEEVHARGVIHRDLKPENVLEARPGVYKVADFGIAKWADGTVRTQAGVVLGTPAYMAPEVVGDGPTFRSDLYSLGILLFELLTGSVPFRSPDALAVLRSHLEVPPPDLSAIRPDIPAGVAAIVSKTLAKDPTQRHESAAELRRALIQELGRSPDASSKFLQVSRDGLAGTGTPGASTIRVERRNRHAATPGTIAVAPSADLGEARPAARLRFRLGLAVAGLAIIVATMGLFRWRGSGSVAIPAPGELPGEIGRLVEEGRSDEAKELLRRLLEPGAGEQGAFYFRGVNPAERTRRLTAAAAAYESVVATRGSDPDAWYGLAVIRSAQGDSVKARAACEKVMALQPRHALASFLLGFHRTASGQPSEDLFRVAADADPGLLDAQFYLGSALSTKGFGKDETTMAEAERRLRLSLPGSTDPARARLALAPVLRCASGGSLAAYRRQSQSNAHILLAMRARKKGRFGEAEDHHREAVAVDPRSIGAHQDFAIFLEDRGRHEEALRECRRALELDPRPGIARSMLGRLLERTGRTAEAEREYRNALVRDGKDERARLALAHLLLRRRDLPGAIRELESGVRSAPENPNLRLFLAERLRDAARHREAEVELRRVLAVRPDDAEARFKLGLTLAALDQPERAEAELRRAVPLGSTDPRHLIETAKFLADRMKLTDAETYCRRTLSIAPENADAVKLRDTLKVFNLVK